MSLTLGGAAERINTGKSSRTVRETSSCVYHVISGSGYIEIDRKKIAWKQGDTFCVPTWNKYEHVVEGSETVYLYRFDDQPMIKALGFYRTESMGIESLVA